MSGGAVRAVVPAGLSRADQDDGVGSFEMVADEYDAARPSYPDAVYDALGPLDGLRVLDVGAGTGIATRALIARNAKVVAVDPGRAVLRRATAHTSDLPAVAADGALLPVRAGAVDLVCFAQAWHWLDESRRVAEAHRVLRPGGRWAGWWSHARADGEPWFDEYWAEIERSCPGTDRRQRDTDWGETVAAPGWFDVGDRVTVPWIREISVAAWMTDQASHSYVAGLPDGGRGALLGKLRTVLDENFPDGALSVRYETWLWIATRI
jgi:SAM-dependent methyltransferase